MAAAIKLFSSLPLPCAVFHEATGSSLVVKSTWRAGPKEMRLSAIQAPLSRAVPDKGGTHLRRPNDFRPMGDTMMVVVTGLESRGPDVPFELRVDEWCRTLHPVEPAGVETRQVELRGDEPAARVSLLPRALGVGGDTSRVESSLRGLECPLVAPRFVSIGVPGASTTFEGIARYRASCVDGSGERKALALQCETMIIDCATRSLILVHRALLPAKVVEAIQLSLPDGWRSSFAWGATAHRTLPEHDLAHGEARATSVSTARPLRPRFAEEETVDVAPTAGHVAVLPFRVDPSMRPPSRKREESYVGLPFERPQGSVASFARNPLESDVHACVATTSPTAPMEMSLDTYVGIRAALARGAELATVLQGFEVPLIAYRSFERAIMHHLVREARHGRRDLELRLHRLEASLVMERRVASH